MDKELNLENIENNENEALETVAETEAAESETAAETVEAKPLSFFDVPAPQAPRKPYQPKFTDASERYRMRGDARIRERLGIKTPSFDNEQNPDEIKFDATAEFEEDIVNAPAKAPENVAVDESDETLNVFKFTEEDREAIDLAAEREREEIRKLLHPDYQPTTTPDEPVAEEESTDEPEISDIEPELEAEVEAEPVDEPEVDEADSDEAPDLPDPDDVEYGDFGVYEFGEEEEDLYDDFEDEPSGIEEANAPREKKKQEFNNPAERDSIKDRFLDSLIAVRIRSVASFVFAAALLLLELLSATKVIPFNMFDTSTSYASLGVIDFLLASCIFIMSIPETVRAIKRLANKQLVPDILALPSYVILGLYTLAVLLTGAPSYPLFGLLFATVAIPTISATLYRTKADFIAFKMISQGEEKQIVDKRKTRELPQENIALDGIVDEFKSRIGRSFRTSFVSDFFKNSEGVVITPKHIAFIFGIPFGAGLVFAAAAYFLSWSVVTSVATLALTVMLGCPAFAIISNKVSFFHTQRAALLTDSTAIGEDAYHNFSDVDVFAFDDSDLFGPDDVNLKRFMLYGERDSMEKVMRQMSALFAAVGGPLDYMFSNAIDNRVRHKTANNLIIEDDGICGDVAGHKISAGSEDYMRRNGIALPTAAATAEKAGTSFDTIRVMYAAEDGEVYAKFYIRYSFSEEFTATLPSLREAGIVPLVYTRDPNVSAELLNTLTTGLGGISVVKLYKPLKEETVYNRVSATMVTYGDKLDAAGMIVLAKRFKNFSNYLRFAEFSAMAVGVVLSLILALIGFGRVTALAAALWQVLWCFAIRYISKRTFVKKEENTNE